MTFKIARKDAKVLYYLYHERAFTHCEPDRPLQGQKASFKRLHKWGYLIQESEESEGYALTLKGDDLYQRSKLGIPIDPIHWLANYLYNEREV